MFPQNPAIEYTTGGGETWYHLRRYYFLEDHQKGKYDPYMGFPNPRGATLVLDLDGVVANGIRISSKLYPIEKGADGAETSLNDDESSLYPDELANENDPVQGNDIPLVAGLVLLLLIVAGGVVVAVLIKRKKNPGQVE